jgi:hypothetical protein
MKRWLTLHSHYIIPWWYYMITLYYCHVGIYQPTYIEQLIQQWLMIWRLIRIDPLSPWLDVILYYRSSTPIYPCNPLGDLVSMDRSAHDPPRCKINALTVWEVITIILRIYERHLDILITMRYSMNWRSNRYRHQFNGSSWSRRWSGFIHYHLGWMLICTVDQVHWRTHATPLVSS